MLKLSDEQKAKLRSINFELDKTTGEIRVHLRFNTSNSIADRNEARQRIAERRKQAAEEARALLTDSQKTTLNELTGEPFEFTPEPPSR